jgi:hypothetical protein
VFPYVEPRSRELREQDLPSGTRPVGVVIDQIGTIVEVDVVVRVIGVTVIVEIGLTELPQR